MLRNTPDPKYIARASETPIANAKTKAVETEGRNFLSLSFAFVKLQSARVSSCSLKQVSHQVL